jgi:hypothetical protein
MKMMSRTTQGNIAIARTANNKSNAWSTAT